MLETRLYLRPVPAILESDTGKVLRRAYAGDEGTDIVTGLVHMLQQLHAKQEPGPNGQVEVPNRLNHEETHTVPLLGMLTSLPHHDSPGYAEDAAALLACFQDLATAGVLPRPALVTVARSAEDHYTPAGMVERFEQDVLSAVKAGAWLPGPAA